MKSHKRIKKRLADKTEFKYFIKNLKNPIRVL